MDMDDTVRLMLSMRTGCTHVVKTRDAFNVLVRGRACTVRYQVRKSKDGTGGLYTYSKSMSPITGRTQEDIVKLCVDDALLEDDDEEYDDDGEEDTSVWRDYEMIRRAQSGTPVRGQYPPERYPEGECARKVCDSDERSETGWETQGFLTRRNAMRIRRQQHFGPGPVEPSELLRGSSRGARGEEDVSALGFPTTEEDRRAEDEDEYNDDGDDVDENGERSVGKNRWESNADCRKT